MSGVCSGLPGGFSGRERRESLLEGEYAGAGMFGFALNIDSMAVTVSPEEYL